MTREKLRLSTHHLSHAGGNPGGGGVWILNFIGMMTKIIFQIIANFKIQNGSYWF